MTGESTWRSRAVSDAVGFAVTFAVVITAVALVYTLGVGAINDVQQAQQIETTQRTFGTLADNLDDVNQEGAPGRATELRLNGGTLDNGEPVVFTINVTGDATGSIPLVLSPITYRRGATALHYTSGAVVRADRGRSILVRDPPFRFGDERVVLSAVQTVGGPETVGGQGTVLVVTRRQTPPDDLLGRTGNESEPVNFTVSITSPRFRAWERYFNDSRADASWAVTVDAANETVTLQGETESFYVRRTRVLVDLRS